MAANRVAIVIGVNSTGELAPLESAVQAADDVAAWLKAEGFNVSKFTDAVRPVRVEPIRKVVTKVVNSGTCEQMVLYFSGHGYWNNKAELWLLSGAPNNPGEAVSSVDILEYAIDSGVPHVVVISDACRSIPTSNTGMRVKGTVLFPNNPPNTRVQPKIDRLNACAMGTPAYEVSLPEEATKISVFTHCLRKAFTNPDTDMVLKLEVKKRAIEVVPVRRLELYLRREVPRVLSRASVALQQLPVVDVTSDDKAYIGQVRRRAKDTVAAPRPGMPPVTVQDVARTQVDLALGSAAPTGGLQRYQRGAAAVAARQVAVLRAMVEEDPPVTRYESQTGFTVAGARVRGAVAGFGGALDLADDRHPNPSAVRVWLAYPENHCSVAITFDNGCGTVLAALAGYIGHITVSDGGVSNVSYVPSANSQRWAAYAKRRKEIERLRSAVSVASALGAFRLPNEDAYAFADRVRIQKQFDPTLGLHAAYAYADAGAYDQVSSVRSYMSDDLDVSLFDVAMLDRDRLVDPHDKDTIVPFCPMLSQGWHYLGSRGIRLPRVLQNAQYGLVQSLWTTFDAKSMRAINRALREGRLA